MPRHPKAMPGAALSWSFDREAPGFPEEIGAFTQVLTRLQAEQGFKAFVPLAREIGTQLEVHILPAATEAPAGAVSAESAADLGQRIKNNQLGDKVLVKRAGTAPLPQVNIDNIDL